MRGRVPVRRRVAAADLAARHAHAEVNPAGADLQAFLAPCDRLRKLRHLDLVEVAANGIRGHALSLLSLRARPRSPRARRATMSGRSTLRARAQFRVRSAGTSS